MQGEIRLIPIYRAVGSALNPIPSQLPEYAVPIFFPVASNKEEKNTDNMIIAALRNLHQIFFSRHPLQSNLACIYWRFCPDQILITLIAWRVSCVVK